MSSEFTLINQFFKPLSQLGSLGRDEVGIGDDGAVLTPPEGQQLVVVTDTLIEGVHFPVETTAFNVAWKALAVNLSDLAAMGARPAFYSLALSLPESKNHQAWLSDFAMGLKALASQYQIPLVGGDTTRHEKLVVTISAQGWVPSKQAVLRSGAMIGDAIFVSGHIGDAGLALKQLLTGQAYSKKLRLSLDQPQPRVELGRELRGVATSSIDISDGLLADLYHILELSGVGAQLDYKQVPLSDEMRLHMNHHPDDWSLPLTCGDDYELCFTVNQADVDTLKELSEKLNLPLKEIGMVTSEVKKINLINSPEPIDWSKIVLGYSHY